MMDLQIDLYATFLVYPPRFRGPERTVEVLRELPDVSKKFCSRLSEWIGAPEVQICVHDLEGKYFPDFAGNVLTPPFVKSSSLMPMTRFLVHISLSGHTVKLSDEPEPISSLIDMQEPARQMVVVLQELMIVGNIANPGSIRVGAYTTFLNDELYESGDKLGGLGDECVIHATKSSWPRISRLPILDVWNWVDSNGFLEDVSRGRVARAFSAFSHLMHTSDYIYDLFWSMVGIEALFADGADGVSRQVREKSQLLLGRREEYKKQLTKMYNFRSRFVHGDVDFPSLLNAEAYYDNDTYPRDVSEAALTAEAILVASLQELVRRGWNDLSFTYQMQGPAT